MFDSNDENLLEEEQLRAISVKKMPISRGFFPRNAGNFAEKTGFHPNAATLDPCFKEILDSVRKSFVENRESCEEIPEIPSFDADNSAFVLKNAEKVAESKKTAGKARKTTTFAEKVSNIAIPNKKNSKNTSNIENSTLSFSEKSKEILEKLLNNNYSVAIITLLTIYCLFGDDFRVAFVEKDYDIAFNCVSIFAIATFSLEIAISIIVKPNYYLSFFFWLDLISTISILLDLVWIQNLIFMGGTSSNITRASRFSKIGAKAGRVIRLVRLFRIVKLYKAVFEKQREKELQEMNEIRKSSIFVQDLPLPSLKSGNSLKDKRRRASSLEKLQNFSNNSKQVSIFCSGSSEKWYLSPTLRELYKRKSRNPESCASSFSQSPDILLHNSFLLLDNGEKLNEFPEDAEFLEAEANAEESRVGKKLTDLTIKRVLLLVFFMIFVVPLFAANYWYDPTLSYDIGLRILANFTETLKNSSQTLENNTELSALCAQYVRENSQEIPSDKEFYPLISLSSAGEAPSNCSFSDVSRDNSLRDEEKDLSSAGDFVAAIDKKSFSVKNAVISIGRTVYICLVLGISALFFTKDAHDLVLRPIERMLIKVNNISKNPLASKYQKLIGKTQGKEEDLETIFIENAIVKISTLLALGFGDAGAEIITSNVAKTGDLVCISPGNKRYGIFGFCDIRNFTDSTEVLQEDVMIFVNNIAEIVHTMVDRFQGSANKNIGDAFLLVWKFRVQDYQYIHSKLQKLDTFVEEPREFMQELPLFPKKSEALPGSFEETTEKYVTDLTDLALMSYLKIICKLRRAETLEKYRTNVLLNQRIHGYRVKMGFGLHLGWAIEGSIGSDYKIDASYLSPNINISSRLEAATKQYGVPLLFSHSVAAFLSAKLLQLSRKCDRVAVKGSQTPVSLYTLDLEVEKLEVKPKKPRSKRELNEIRLLKKIGIAVGLENRSFDFEELFAYDKDMKIACVGNDSRFSTAFAQGVYEYLRGDWKQARCLLNEALKFKENDGPCANLLDFMGKCAFCCPGEWKGFRTLDEK